MLDKGSGSSILGRGWKFPWLEEGKPNRELHQAKREVQHLKAELIGKRDF